MMHIKKEPSFLSIYAGNGTSQIFYRNPDVLLFDFHQHPQTLYPGTGYINDIGEEKGKGYNINLPMVPLAGDAQYLEVIEEIFVPVISQFGPDIVLISAGFDTHFSDPLTQLNITVKGYGKIIKRVKEEAEKVCNGKIIILLEGGYDLKAISQGVLTEISVLGDLGIEFDDAEPKIEDGVINYNKKMMARIKKILNPYWIFE